MLTELFTQLPAASSANLTDIICAVQGFVSPSVLGTSTQMTLAQVAAIINSSVVLEFAGNPNGNVAGTPLQLLWDSTDNILYVCTTAGSSSTAVWTPVIGQLTNGQIRIGSTGNTPVATTITAGNNLLVTNGPGSITISTAPMAANTLLGNNTAGSAQPIPLIVAQVLTLLGVTAVGTAPVGQIPGATSNTPAGTGDIGEIMKSVIASGSAISISNNTPKTVVSLSLTPGNWMISSNLFYIGSSNINTAWSGVSTTNNTLPDESLYAKSAYNLSDDAGVTSPTIPVSLATTTTYFLIGKVSFPSGSVTVCGGIYAVRTS
jgi:hypothetical protein